MSMPVTAKVPSPVTRKREPPIVVRVVSPGVSNRSSKMTPLPILVRARLEGGHGDREAVAFVYQGRLPVERPLLIRTFMYWGEDTVGASTDGGVGVRKGPAQAVGRGADVHQVLEAAAAVLALLAWGAEVDQHAGPAVGFTVKRDEIWRLAPAP
jgi:hypothetical protein